ncbi:hypothetical protein EXIGLDRAFT_777378 [Exidia glandulosa HHB12029]|uniref:Uncharacterized protein n=1 Tax=Exidia glandulosa HHB12029 TaxID=1314781 RepID=A0A165D1G2_EXIGL|nr:hypothetical protein EXIGLDRAFT_777378 [Exidia glandulosa HHB12029]
MNISDTSSDYYDRSLSSTPSRLARPGDDSALSSSLLLPIDIHAAALQRYNRIMTRHNEKKNGQEHPDSDRGSSSPPATKPTRSKAPEPPREVPARMPGAKGPQQPAPAPARRTRQQSAVDGVDPPVYDLPPPRRSAPTKPANKDPAPLLNLPGPSPPVVLLKKPTQAAKKDAVASARAKPVAPTIPVRNFGPNAFKLFGPAPAKQAPPPPRPAAAPRAKEKAQAAVEPEPPSDERVEPELAQDGDDDADVDEEDALLASPTVAHVKRRAAVPKPANIAPKRLFEQAKRSTRFAQPAEEDEDAVDTFDDDDVFGAYETVTVAPPRGTKRAAPPRAQFASKEDGASPPRKRVSNPFAHIVPGFEGDKRIAMVPDCVREIVEGGFKIYLPVHLFALEVLQQEEEARVNLRPGESIASRLPAPTVPESQATLQQWMQWTKRMIACLEALEVPEFIVDMYRSHFRNIELEEDLVPAWTVWRYYDMRRRQMFKGEHPHDISRLDRDLLARMRDKVTGELHARMESAIGKSRTAGHASSSKPVASSSTQEPRVSGTSNVLKLKYSRCMICGSNTHVFDKDVARKDCETRWLVYDAVKGAWKCPDTGSYICWLFNGTSGCTKKTCRLREKGHRCALCGSSAHGCHGCPVHP